MNKLHPCIAVGMSMIGMQLIADTGQTLGERGCRRVGPHYNLPVVFSTGVAVGMGMVGMQHIADTGQTLRERGYRRVSPYFIPSVLINMAAGHISLKFGLQVTSNSI